MTTVSENRPANPSVVEAESLLALDIGSVNTRALLFDIVDGRYRFLAAGSARSTAGAPYHDVGEGVRQAIDDLQRVTGRTLIGADEQILMPTGADGSGIDSFAVTSSAGPPLGVVVVGLLENVSLDSAHRLAQTILTGQLESISLNDRRKADERIDRIVAMRPDVIIVAGGTECGASQSLLKLLEAVGLACYLLPESQRPAVLYAGNSDLEEEVQSTIGGICHLQVAPNIRPTLDVEALDPAHTHLVDIYRRVRTRQIPGFEDLTNRSKGGFVPTATAFGRIIRFLAQATGPKKGVLGVDLGASAASIISAYQDKLALGVYPEYGLGAGLAKLLNEISLKEISRWLSLDIADLTVRDYLYQKALYPESLPATPEDLAIEQALARVVLRLALQKAMPGFPAGIPTVGPGLLPRFEPIVASGGTLGKAPTLAQSLLMLLDGLQPTGATTVVLDQNIIMPALGAAAAINPLAPVQVLDSTAALYLGTVISPAGSSRPGTPILRVKISYPSGHETTLDVKQGALEVLPLPLGQSATLRLTPLQRLDVGMDGPGRGGALQVHGGALGVVIDARGRPLVLPEDAGRRRELFSKWMWTLGG
ncbi:MAG TPA: glutamate mutase L [Anaerolineales bacterium]|nr:glutamate mutase L [Anaerolineales bacterium]